MASYQQLGRFYDLIYSWKNYAREAKEIHALAKRFKKSKGRALLDLGCGTGEHLKALAKYFKCTGLDLNGEMLKVAKRKLPSAKWVKGNMSSFRLKDRYDIIVSLFSCIGYVKTDVGLKGAVRAIAEHLKPGGVALIEPWFGPDFEAGRMFMHTYDGADVKVVRQSRSFKKGKLSTLEMNFMVMERGKPILRFAENHHLGLFEIKHMLSLFRKAGLKTKFFRIGSFKDRGLIVAFKPLSKE